MDQSAEDIGQLNGCIFLIKSQKYTPVSFLRGLKTGKTGDRVYLRTIFSLSYTRFGKMGVTGGVFPADIHPIRLFWPKSGVRAQNGCSWRDFFRRNTPDPAQFQCEALHRASCWAGTMQWRVSSGCVIGGGCGGISIYNI